jgi:hypothetical protein
MHQAGTVTTNLAAREAEVARGAKANPCNPRGCALGYPKAVEVPSGLVEMKLLLLKDASA